MKRHQVTVYYRGRVQGVGFRYTVKSLAPGFEVIGTVRNLTDGRVELIAEGEKSELEAFLKAIREAGLGPLVQHEEIRWGEARNWIRGFEIVG